MNKKRVFTNNGDGVLEFKVAIAVNDETDEKCAIMTAKSADGGEFVMADGWGETAIDALKCAFESAAEFVNRCEEREEKK